MVPVFEAKENPVAGNDGALIKESSTGSEATDNDTQSQSVIASNSEHIFDPDPQLHAEIAAEQARADETRKWEDLRMPEVEYRELIEQGIRKSRWADDAYGGPEALTVKRNEAYRLMEEHGDSSLYDQLETEEAAATEVRTDYAALYGSSESVQERLSDKEMIDLMLDAREAELDDSFSGGSGGSGSEGGSGSGGGDGEDIEELDDFFTRPLPLHEVAYRTIASDMDSKEFAQEMEDVRREGQSVHEAAGLRLLHKINNAIIRENSRRNSPELKLDLLKQAGGKKVEGGYVPFSGWSQDPVPLDKALSIAGVKVQTLKAIENLNERMTIQILSKLEVIIKVDLTGLGEHDKAPLAVYDRASGLYFTDEVLIQQLISKVNRGLSGRQPENAMNMLRAEAPLVKKTESARYIPVANGVFDHKKQKLKPFSHTFVFLNKIPIRYNPDAQSPVIVEPDGTRWEFCDWLRQLAVDHQTGEEQEGIYELLWEVLSAIVRPGVRYNKAVFLYSKQGNNGKGTFCQLARNLKGERGHASIPISKFGKPFALAPLMHADAVIVDENPVGAFSEELDVFKSVVTGDTFTLERKHKDGYNARFEGVMVQCINDIPKTKDKSASLARRQLFVPFKNHFGGDGIERKHIKEDYLARPEVLEFVLKTALEMNHTAFSEPAATKELLEQARTENDHVREFWFDHWDRYVWDLLPEAFLYDHFKAWFAKNIPSGKVLGRPDFRSRLQEVVREQGVFEYREGPMPPGSKMDVPEHMIDEYDLEDWMNPKAKGSADLNKKCMPIKAKSYRRVLVRI